MISNMLDKQIERKGFVLLLGLIALIAVTFQMDTINVSADGAYYLSQANFIEKGQGYVYGKIESNEIIDVFERGPVAPYIISLGLKLTPDGLLGPYLILRLLYVLFVLLTVYFVSIMFGRDVAMLSAFFVVLFGFFQERTSIIHLEVVYLFFMMSATVLLAKASIENKKYYFAVAGVFFGLSYLTTEIPLFFLPIPLLMYHCFRDSSRRDWVSGIIMFYLFFGLTMLPWALYLFSNDKLVLILGRVIPLILGGEQVAIFPYSIGGGNIKYGSFIYYVQSWWKFYMVGVSAIAPLWIVAWVWVIYKSVKSGEGKERYYFMSIFLVPFGIIVLGQLMSGARQAQALLFYIFSFIALAIFIVDLVQSFFNKMTEMSGRFVHFITLFCLLLGVFGVEVFIGDHAFASFFKKLTVYKALKHKKISLPQEDILYQQAKDLSTYVNSNLPIGGRIVVDENRLLNAMLFYVGDRYSMYRLPYQVYPQNIKRRDQQENNISYTTNVLDVPLLVVKNGTYSPLYPDVYRTLSLRSLDQLYEDIKFQFILSNGRVRNASLYNSFSNVTNVRSNSLGNATIYKVEGNWHSSLDTILTTENTLKALRRYSINDNDNFSKMVNVLFVQNLGWTDSEIKKFIGSGRIQ